MAALFMDLLVALTSECLILFKTMLFVCAWVLTELLPHPVYVWKQMSPLSILGEKKLSLQYCLKLRCNYSNPAYATVFNSKFYSVFESADVPLRNYTHSHFSILNFTLYLKENPLNYFLLQSVFQVICKQLVLKRVMLLHLLYHPHCLGF